MFFASQVLETITQNSARMILTGQAQQGVLHPGAVRGLCLHPGPGAVRPATKIYIDVGFPSFSNVTIAEPDR